MKDLSCTMQTYYRSRLAMYLHEEFKWNKSECRKAMKADYRGPIEGAKWVGKDQETSLEELRLAMLLAEEDWLEELQDLL